MLQSDPAMASWLGGADFDAATSAGTLEGVFQNGLDGLPCRGGMLPDGGVIMPHDAPDTPGLPRASSTIGARRVTDWRRAAATCAGFDRQMP